MDYKMFCYQCQETANCSGCTVSGVCGKKPDTANMQDLLVYVTKGISAVTTRLRAEGKQIDKNVNHLITLNLFTTITNANFDKDVITERIKNTLEIKAKLLNKITDKSSLSECGIMERKRKRVYGKGSYSRGACHRERGYKKS